MLVCSGRTTGGRPRPASRLWRPPISPPPSSASFAWRLARRGLAPAPLRALLGFLFIAALSSGLEPATSAGQGARRPSRLRASPRCLPSRRFKALAATPPLALIWRMADRVPLDRRSCSPAWPPTVRRRLLGERAARAARSSRPSRRRPVAQAGQPRPRLRRGTARLARRRGRPAGWLALATAPRLFLALAAAGLMARPDDWRVGVGDPAWPTPAGSAMALTSGLAAVGGSADRLAGSACCRRRPTPATPCSTNCSAGSGCCPISPPRCCSRAWRPD